jgi:plastocyanin
MKMPKLCQFLCCVTAPLAHAAPLTVNVVDGTGKPLAGAVVMLDVKGAKKTAEPGTQANLAQRSRQFDPGVLVVQTGTSVNFPNFDTVRHHVYSFSPIKSFEIKLYAGTPSAPVVFDKPGIAVLGCNIHDSMVAHVLVVDTPYFARTDDQGQAVLQAPAGEHQLKVWHDTLPEGTPPAAVTQKLAEAGTSATLTLGVKSQ